MHGKQKLNMLYVHFITRLNKVDNLTCYKHLYSLSYKCAALHVCVCIELQRPVSCMTFIISSATGF